MFEQLSLAKIILKLYYLSKKRIHDGSCLASSLYWLIASTMFQTTFDFYSDSFVSRNGIIAHITERRNSSFMALVSFLLSQKTVSVDFLIHYTNTLYYSFTLLSILLTYYIAIQFNDTFNPGP